jgi:hypothetical protein
MKVNTEFSAGMKWSAVNAEYLLESLNELFEDSGNPAHAWLAIYFCTKFSEPLPGWVIAYLARCSKRMIIDKRDASDLRAVLPQVLGFPKKKPGPGKLLQPGPDEDKISFTREFVNYILQGDDPKTARKEACNHTFSRKVADKVDDKTLVHWLVDTMGLVKTPQNAKQWKTAVYRYLALDLAQHARWNANATEEDHKRADALAKKLWGR